MAFRIKIPLICCTKSVERVLALVVSCVGGLESLSPAGIINNTAKIYEENGVFGFNCAIVSPVFSSCALSFVVMVSCHTGT
jgi:hypothetical protein